MKKALIAVAAVILSLCLLLCACNPLGGGDISGGSDENNGETNSPSGQVSGMRGTFYSMNTLADIWAYDDFTTAESKEKFNQFYDECKGILKKVESSLGVSNSFVTKFNDAEAGERVEIDELTFNALSCAVKIYNLTGGYYNPAVYYCVEAYGFNGGKNPESVEELPKEETLQKFVELSKAFSELKIEEEEGRYYATKPLKTVEVEGQTLSLKIDLGGVGKGYAADLISDLYDKYGYDKGYFNFGTSSLAFKSAYDGKEYNIAVTNPREINKQYFVFTGKNVNLSTSGDYENFFLLDTDGDGKAERFCHIFDPTTGKPVNTGIMTATVIGGSAAEDDALSTAIMAMGVDGAINFIKEELSDKKVVFTFSRGGVNYYYTNDETGKPQGNSFVRYKEAGDGA